MTPDSVCCLPTETAVRIAKVHHKQKLLGIVTDRDLALKVIGEGRDPKTTKAEDVKTRMPGARRRRFAACSCFDANKQVRRISSDR